MFKIPGLNKNLLSVAWNGVSFSPETSEQEINGVRVVKNTDENRLQLFFDGKPNAEMITKLKGAAFRWSPRNKAWQRVLTDNAVAAANRILAQ